MNRSALRAVEAVLDKDGRKPYNARENKSQETADSMALPALIRHHGALKAGEAAKTAFRK